MRRTACCSWPSAPSARSPSSRRRWTSTARTGTSRSDAPCASRACRRVCWRFTRPGNARSAPSCVSSAGQPCASASWRSMSTTAATASSCAWTAASPSCSARWPSTGMPARASRPSTGQNKCRTTSEPAKYVPTEETRHSPPSLPSQAAEDQTPTAVKDVRPKTKNTSRFPLLSENSTKQAPRGTDKTLDPPLKPVVDDPAYNILRRCPQCDILLPLPTLNQHQEKCWWLASWRGKQGRNSS
ncbi:XIAP-associated factor 1 isoform X3 [Myotis myotis]|uniref:XIAP-associated factor 1 isoform X3 n=1 Tax=Myotis myotis TaxID=51298 RepID=UPI001749B2AA|nr:XIAP-associated factor 1 isoform X3 [Myotis myotis]XP_036197729.1 XIAP-associated factor 1 isoform X3 [Myotis myotis]